MAVASKVDFKAEVKRLFDHFDRQEFAKVKEMFADDAQGVDEISRVWLRGKPSMDGYFAQLGQLGVTDIHSKLSDSHVKQWDDIALATCVADQTYMVKGQEVSIKAPTSVLFRRVGDQWKIQLVHAVPLPEPM